MTALDLSPPESDRASNELICLGFQSISTSVVDGEYRYARRGCASNCNEDEKQAETRLVPWAYSTLLCARLVHYLVLQRVYPNEWNECCNEATTRVLIANIVHTMIDVRGRKNVCKTTTKSLLVIASRVMVLMIYGPFPRPVFAEEELSEGM